MVDHEHGIQHSQCLLFLQNILPAQLGSGKIFGIVEFVGIHTNLLSSFVKKGHLQSSLMVGVLHILRGKKM